MTEPSRILVVEDNEMNAKLVRDVLEFKGYLIDEAGTAEKGLSLAQEHTPDLVLMDIHLPGMDGIEALKHLRSDPATRDIPVVALTASAMPDDAEVIKAAGFDAYETKPIGVKRLGDLVIEMIGKGPNS